MAEITEVRTFDVALMEKLNGVNECLPKDFNKARFVQNSMALFNDKPELKKYPQQQLMSGLMKGSYLGLDFLSNEAYLVPFGGKLQFMTSYKGSVKLVKKYSIRPVKDIYARVIRQGDELIEKVVNGEPTIDFIPKMLNDGEIIGAFAVCLYQDGGIAYDVMSKADIENSRSVSKVSGGPWKKFYGEMAKKTVLHRLCKHIDIDFESAEQVKAFTDGTQVDEKTEKPEVENPFNDIDTEQVEDAEFVEVVEGEVVEDEG